MNTKLGFIAGFAIAFLGAAVIAPAVPAVAHEEASGPNGGQVADVQGHHVEFTAKENEIVLFLTDESGKPIDSKGASGRAVILAGDKQVTAELAPADPNILSAKLSSPIASGAKIVVSAKLSDGHALQARFVAK